MVFRVVCCFGGILPRESTVIYHGIRIRTHLLKYINTPHNFAKILQNSPTFLKFPQIPQYFFKFPPNSSNFPKFLNFPQPTSTNLQEPAITFSEQYQIEVLEQAHRAIDTLRREKLLTGEMLWNFADFMTAASRSRPFGNHKGVLTRDRQPKMAAYSMKKRYAKLGEK
jgi:hypothetical protein